MIKENVFGESKNMDEKKTCFVVTPIGDESTDIRRHIDGIIDQAIIPAIGDEFEIKVAHREYEIGSINNRVIQSVYNSDLVVANLTGLNPNVMFELAIRYSFGKPAIVIAEDGTKLPFDITDENTIFYINDPTGASVLRDRIKKFVEKINLDKFEYGPVFAAIKNAAVINHIESGISDKDNKNAFSFLVEKMSDLEAEIRELKVNEYNNERREKSIISSLNFLQQLKKSADHLSREDLEMMINKYLYDTSRNTKIDIYSVQRDLIDVTVNDHTMQNRLKKNILDILNGL